MTYSSRPAPIRPDVHATLVRGLAELTSSRRWREWLAMQARFPSYSYGNVLLIGAQCPSATRVAGYRAWRGLGRHVRRGERAIYILAPLWRRDRSGGAHAATVAADAPRRLVGFRPVAVFDISQTEGAELPEICQPLTGPDRGDNFARLVEVAGRLGFDVVRRRLGAGVNGECHLAVRQIVIDEALHGAQAVKTLAHELAHGLLHEGETDRARAELEAESTAYLLCRELGIDSAEYSFGYVASWSGGGDAAAAAIGRSCSRITMALSRLLDIVSESDPTNGCSVPTRHRTAEVSELPGVSLEDAVFLHEGEEVRLGERPREVVTLQPVEAEGDHLGRDLRVLDTLGDRQETEAMRKGAHRRDDRLIGR
jgi:hypothetical protein